MKKKNAENFFFIFFRFKDFTYLQWPASPFSLLVTTILVTSWIKQQLYKHVWTYVQFF